MRYYKKSEDWISHLDGEFRQELIVTLRSLDLGRLQKYPPPKLVGLPFGNEPRIFWRFIRNGSIQLEPSALAALYRSKMSAETFRLYRAFRKNQSLAIEDWQVILGERSVECWRENKSLTNDVDRSLYCSFTVIALDGLVFCVDPLKDHGEARESESIVSSKTNDALEVQPYYHTYIGLDSLRMIEWMQAQDLPTAGRYLDCGTGAGGLLLYFGRHFDEVVGIDINPRAAKLAQFNAELNGIANCTTLCGDAINRNHDLGEFDLVTWNLPFIFMPEDLGDEAIDGFGGEMGIALCLEFIKSLRPLLQSQGTGCIAALAPVLDDGKNVLEERLRAILPDAGLDCSLHVIQTSIAHTRELWQFHRANKIRKFESVYLSLKPGTGRLDRVGARMTRRVIDTLRENMYKWRYQQK